ncbi:MAG TPA: hypothetical protein VNI01_04690 [Elusimicrobiota bacterium]|nr:hypothetical protein [Elusimicrobiota bacterium]
MKTLAAALLLAAARASAVTACTALAQAVRGTVYSATGKELSCLEARDSARRLRLAFVSQAQGAWTYAGSEELRAELQGRGLRLPPDVVIGGYVERSEPLGRSSAFYVLALAPDSRVAGALAAAGPVSPSDGILRLPGRGALFDRVGVYAGKGRTGFLTEGTWLPFRGGAWGADQKEPEGVRLCVPCKGWLCPAEPVACFSDFDGDGREEAHFTGLAVEGKAPLLVLDPAEAGARSLFSRPVGPVAWRLLGSAWAMVPEPGCEPGRFCTRSGVDGLNPSCPRPKVWRFVPGKALVPDDGLRERAYPVSLRRLPPECSRGKEVLAWSPEDGYILFRP